MPNSLCGKLPSQLLVGKATGFKFLANMWGLWCFLGHQARQQKEGLDWLFLWAGCTLNIHALIATPPPISMANSAFQRTENIYESSYWIHTFV
jgi:hypothetical protein